MDTKGIVTFLITAVGLTWAIRALWALTSLGRVAGPVAESGTLVVILLIPAFAALLAHVWRSRGDYPRSRIWPVSKNSILVVSAVVPLVFAIVYALTSVFGWAKPDWSLQGLLFKVAQGQHFVGMSSFVLVSGMVLTVVLGPTVYALLCVGVEWGWRGYLLPRLIPMGRIPAHLLIGLFTAIWALPIVFDPFHGWEYLMVPALCMLGVSITVSAALNELWLRTRHTGLSAVCAGCFLSQGLGVWRYLFPQAAAPYGGALGLVSMIVWLGAAILVARIPLPGLAAPAVAPNLEQAPAGSSTSDPA